MKTQVISLISLIICLGSLYSGNISAQSDEELKGKITGTVVDAESGETLIGVNVIVNELRKGSSTDINGSYTVDKVPAGTYSVTASYVSYQSQKVTDVIIRPGETINLDFTLGTDTKELDEVVITAELVLNNEAGLLRERQKSTAISDAISIEAISQSGGSNAADALSKVTGASVVGGKYVYVRGLGDRYTNSQLNGVNLPSADPDRNATNFDIFPANLLSSVVTTKTFTPDQPGNFTGGNVNIRTKNYPSAFTLSLGSSFSFNSQSSFADNFLQGQSSDTDRWGYDSDRGIPFIVKANNNTVPNYTTVIRDPEGASFLTKATRSFGNEMIPTQKDALTSYSNSFTLGNNSMLLGRKLGYILSLNYGQDVSHYDDGVSRAWVATDPVADELAADYNFSDWKSEKNVNWGVLTNISYQVTPTTEYSFRYLRTQDGTSTGRIQEGPFVKNTQSQNVIFETYVTKYVERDIESFQLSGKHAFGAKKRLKIDWDASKANSGQNEPNLRFFFHEYSEITLPDTTFRNYSINLGSSNASPPTRIFRNLAEENDQLNLNVEFPLNFGLSRAVKFKTGGSYMDKKRDFSEFRYDYSFGQLRYRDFNGDINAFFADENMGVVDTTRSGIFRFGNTLADKSVASNNYDGSQTITAAYAMLEIPVTRRLSFIGGARMEITDMSTVSLDTTKTPGKIQETDILPSVNLTYSVNENMNIRLAASQTIARPTFREIAPFQAFDFAGGRVISGNPDLERTLVQNYDFRWEWFMRPGEIIAVSTYYKNFSNPIERVMISNNFQETYQNVSDAQVYGVELEARTNLDWLADALKYFSVGGNLAITESKVDVPQRELEFGEGFDLSKTRQFQGQSPYIVNMTASYSNPKWGFNSTVTFNKYGDRLKAVGIGGTPNIFEQSRDDLYFSASQDLFQGLSIKFAIDNLLNDSYRTIQTYKGKDYTVTKYELGRTFKFSVSYDF